MRTRIVSGLMLIGVVVAVLSAPAPYFALVLLLLAGACAYEFCAMAQAGGYQPVRWVAIGGSVLLVLDAYLESATTHPNLIVADFTVQRGLALPILLGALLVSLLWKGTGGQVVQARSNFAAGLPSLVPPSLDRAAVSRIWLDLALTLGCLLYVGWLLRLGWYVYLDSVWWLAFVILCTASADTGAYFSGTRWGKHKMIPWISPGKTWEGTIGGILTAIVVAVLFSFGGLIPTLSPLAALLLAAVLAPAAVLGDLIESMLKRAMGVKDSSHLIPGHGGLLDRLDSIIFALVVVYFYLSASSLHIL